MFVRPSEEIHISPALPLEAGDHVCSYRGVGMPEVRLTIDVVDGRTDIERRCILCHHALMCISPFGTLKHDPPSVNSQQGTKGFQLAERNHDDSYE